MKRKNIRRAVALISFLLFPVTIFFLSPYVIIDGAVKGIVTGSCIVFAIMFFGSLFTGRIFCSWICPMGALQDYCFGINSKKVRGRTVDKIKYFIWVPWVISIIAIVIFAGGFKEIDPLYMTYKGISIDEPLKYIIYFFILALFVVLAFTIGKRGACHSICWMAPFMVIGSKTGKLLRLPAIHLMAESSKCNNCKACEAKCPMSLEVNAMVKKESMLDSECILCGECVDNCPRKAIGYDFGKVK